MNVVLGVTGSISAYKACDIVSGLVSTGCEVKVIMTESAKMFIPAMPLAVLSGHPVVIGFEGDDQGKISHTSLAEWADYFVIAPASANTIAKICNGYCDNVLTAMALCYNITRCSGYDGPYEHLTHSLARLICPAMNPNMYNSDIVQSHLETLRQRNWEIMEPVIGRLACGDVGTGKLPKPRDIVNLIMRSINV